MVIITILFVEFSHQNNQMLYHWGLNDSKSLQVSRTLFSILTDFNNAIVWMVSTRPLISKSSSTCTSPLVTVARAPITIGITVNFTLHSFFCSLASSWYLSFLVLSYSFTLWSSATAKSTIREALIVIQWPRDFVLYILPLGLVRLRTFRLSAWVSKVQTWAQMFTRTRGECVIRRCQNKNPR